MSWWYLVHGFYIAPNISSLDTSRENRWNQPIYDHDHDREPITSSQTPDRIFHQKKECHTTWTSISNPPGVLECEQPWGVPHRKMAWWNTGVTWPLGDRSWGSKKWLRFQNTVLYQARWWFQILSIFTPIWGRFPFWLIFFKWVETTNQQVMVSDCFFFTLNLVKWWTIWRAYFSNGLVQPPPRWGFDKQMSNSFGAEH